MYHILNTYHIKIKLNILLTKILIIQIGYRLTSFIINNRRNLCLGHLFLSLKNPCNMAKTLKYVDDVMST